MLWCIHGRIHKIQAEREHSVAWCCDTALLLRLCALDLGSLFCCDCKGAVCNNGSGQEEEKRNKHFIFYDMLIFITYTKKVHQSPCTLVIVEGISTKYSTNLFICDLEHHTIVYRRMKSLRVFVAMCVGSPTLYRESLLSCDGHKDIL
jgi:hypothetical protein